MQNIHLKAFIIKGQGYLKGNVHISTFAGAYAFQKQLQFRLLTPMLGLIAVHIILLLLCFIAWPSLHLYLLI